MTTQHTPGPWKARDYANHDGDIWIDCNSWRNPKTASCRGGTLATAHKNGAGEGTAEANARLIAAAPDLLAALHDARTALQMAAQDLVRAGEADKAADIRTAADLARAAIAKATGGA